MNINRYVGERIDAGKKYITEKVSTSINTIYKTYSPWVFAEKVTRLAEKGEAKRIETETIVDLAQFLFQNHWTDYLKLLPTLKRTVHVVNDPELIKEGLKKGRSGERYAIYPTLLNKILGFHNMLLCPTEEHRRLRAPYEKIFSDKALSQDVKSLTILATLCLQDSGKNYYASPEIPLTLRNEIVDLTEKSQLSKQEKNSTLYMLPNAAAHTTSTTLGFIYKLLEQTDWCERILEDWEKRFGPLKEGSFSTFKIYLRDEQDKKLEEQLIAFVKGGEYGGQKIEASSSLIAFVMEVLRLYPVVPQIVRIAKEQFKLGETEIQAGDVVMFNIQGYQRNLEKWEEPLKFDPERFLKNDTHQSNAKEEINPASEKNEKLSLTKGPLLNFSAGPEHCLGKNLANYSLLFSATKIAIEMALEFRAKKNQTLSSKIPSYEMTPPFISK